MTDPLIQIDDEERAEEPTTREVPAKPELPKEVSKDEPPPQPFPTPEALREYKGGDAG